MRARIMLFISFMRETTVAILLVLWYCLHFVEIIYRHGWIYASNSTSMCYCSPSTAICCIESSQVWNSGHQPRFSGSM